MAIFRISNVDGDGSGDGFFRVGGRKLESILEKFWMMGCVNLLMVTVYSFGLVFVCVYIHDTSNPKASLYYFHFIYFLLYLY